MCKNLQKRASQIFLDPIQKHAPARSVQLEAVYLEALLYRLIPQVKEIKVPLQVHSLVRHYITRSPVECFKTHLFRQSVMNADFSVHVIFLNVASCFCIQLSLSTIKKLFLQLNVPFRFYQLSLKKVNNNKHKIS